MARLIDLVPESGFSDGGVSLRLWTPEDVELMMAAGADPDIVRWTNVPDHVGRNDAVQMIEDMLAQSERGWRAALVIQAPEPVGNISLRVNSRVQTGELGYWVLEAARGRGVASRAVCMVRDWSFTTVGLARLQAGIEPDNPGSIALVERLGFTREGVLRSCDVLKGRRIDEVLYSQLPSDLCS